MYEIFQLKLGGKWISWKKFDYHDINLLVKTNKTICHCSTDNY